MIRLILIVIVVAVVIALLLRRKHPPAPLIDEIRPFPRPGSRAGLPSGEGTEDIADPVKRDDSADREQPPDR